MEKDIKFKSGHSTASNCFDSNLKLVIGTFASGMGILDILSLKRSHSLNQFLTINFFLFLSDRFEKYC